MTCKNNNNNIKLELEMMPDKLALIFLVQVIANNGILQGNSIFDGALKPVAPVRREDENLELDCQSPANFLEEHVEIKFCIKYNGTVLVDDMTPTSVLQNIKAAKFVYNVDSVESGDLVCSINGDLVSYTQQLIVIQGNSAVTVLEEGVGGTFDCLTADDKDNKYPIETDWQVGKKYVGNDDGRFNKRNSQLEVKETSTTTIENKLSTTNLNVPIECIMTSKQAMQHYTSVVNASANGASTKIKMTYSVVKISVKKIWSSSSVTAKLCGYTPSLTIEWFENGEKLNSTMRADYQDHNADNSSSAICIMSSVNSTSSNVEIRISQSDKVIWSKNITEETTSNQDQSSPSGGSISAIIGVVLGVLVIIVVSAVVVYCYRKKFGCFKKSKTVEKTQNPEELKQLDSKKEERKQADEDKKSEQSNGSDQQS